MAQNTTIILGVESCAALCAVFMPPWGGGKRAGSNTPEWFWALGIQKENEGVGDEELCILVEKFSAKLLRSKFFTRTDDRAMEKMDESFEYKHLSALFTQDIEKKFLRKQIL